MKILYIITQADGGGAQKYVLSLAKHFNGAIAAGSEEEKLFTSAKMAGLDFFRLDYLKRKISILNDFWAAWEIRQLIKMYHPDIVHLNSSKAGILGSFAAVGLKTKVVFTAHGFVFNEPLSPATKAFYIALEKTASAYRDFIITVSDADKQSALDNKLISANKLQTIHNGIPQINFLPKDEARTKLGLPINKKIMGVVANDYKTKGVDLVNKLLPASGTMVAVIGKMDSDKKSTSDIKYLGPVPDAAVYFKAFDGILIPSRKEGLPFVLLEAMQAGSPVFASDVGGIKTALGDAGETFPPDNLQAMQKVIEVAFVDRTKTEKMSARSTERAKLFTEQKMLDETEKIYKKILGL
jgi:glycosyltransferase involved in cell wall biosynthesis